MRAARDWRALFTRWQPHGSLILLCVAHLALPHASFFILALLHWTALDALRTRRSADETVTRAAYLGASLADQFKKVEDGHRFAGDEVDITSEQTYSGGGKSFIVRVEREAVGVSQ